MKITQFEGSSEFECIGGACIDSCCVGWSVEFDKKTCDMVRHSKKFKKIARQYVYQNDHVMDDKIDYCSVALREDTRCPFLTEVHLCSIQVEMGEAGLSNICALYPRYYNRIDGGYEKNFSLACIEVAKNMLTRKGGLKLVEVTGKPERDVVILDLKSNTKTLKDSGFKDLSKIRGKIYPYLNASDRSLSEKLSGLLHFTLLLERTSQDKRLKTIEGFDCTASYKDLIQWEDLKVVLATTLTSIDEDAHPYMDVMIGKLKACEGKLAYFDSSHLEYLFTNYMLMQMQKEVYPFTYIESKMLTHLALVIRIKMIHLLMGLEKSWSQAETVRLIQSFSKAFEHHGMFHHKVYELAQRLSKDIQRQSEKKA